MLRSNHAPRALLFATFSLAALALAGCSSSSSPPAIVAADSGSGGDAAIDTLGDAVADAAPSDSGAAYADPTSDPVPSDLPVVFARTADPGGADVPPDWSCAGKPLPRGGAVTDRVFHLDVLGLTDDDRVEGAKVELFFAGGLAGKPDVSAVTKIGASSSDPDRGTFHASAPSGFVTSHVPKMTNFIETTQLDIDMREHDPTVLSSVNYNQRDVIVALVGGSGYTETPGTTRSVVTVLDCLGRPLSGVHLSLQADGVVLPITKAGVRRNYFGDSRLPGTGKWTSRNGVVVFLEVPSNAKSLILVGRAKLDAASAPTVVVNRPILPQPDGAITAMVNPYDHGK